MMIRPEAALVVEALVQAAGLGADVEQAAALLSSSASLWIEWLKTRCKYTENWSNKLDHSGVQ